MMIPIDRRAALKGLIAATAGFAAAGRAAADGDLSIARWADAAAFVDAIGVNTHMGQRGSVYDRFFEASIAPAIQDLGIRRFREGVFPVVPGATDLFYARVRALGQAGCRLSAICFDPTDRYVTTPPRDLPRIYEACGGAVDMFEGGNEPDLAADPALNPTLSWLHQQGLHDTIRRELAGARLTLASPSYIQGNLRLAKPLDGFADRINLHPYPGMEHPETRGPGRLAGFAEAMRPICGDVGCVVTETGYHTAVATGSGFLPVSEAIRARYMPRLLLFSFLSGMGRTYLYELRSSFDRGPADPESAFGLLGFDGRPTPAYGAVKGLVALFSGPGRGDGAAGPAPARVAIAGERGDLVVAGFRRADGRCLLPVWLAVPGWDSATRTARSAVSRRVVLSCGDWRGSIVAHRFGDDGSVQAGPIPLIDGSAELAASDRLTVLELRT